MRLEIIHILLRKNEVTRKEKFTQHETRVHNFDTKTCPSQINGRMPAKVRVNLSVLKIVVKFFTANMR